MPRAKADPRAQYEKQKAASGARVRAISAAGRDIGDIPPVKDSARKEAAWHSFRLFCESYFPLKFSLAWSPDHLKMIDAIERAVSFGGLFALAMPRGSGKTTLCEVAAIWALLTGRKRFVFLIGSSEAQALNMLENIKSELSHNERLHEDFPEVCHAIACLDGESRRTAGQLHHGRKTSIEWGADEIVLPSIPGSPAAGSLVRVAGLTGNIRGALRTLETGESIRPDIVILDDPQTDESAKSESQNDQREGIINGAVLGLAGPGKTISALMPCTVIRPGDMVDRILDRTKHPDWRGERTQMVRRWPDREDLWDEYARIRAESLRAGNEGREATEFYAANREEMDRGADVSWPERHRPDELSGLQHAYNLKIRNPRAFAAEYQNAPEIDEETSGKLDPVEIAGKLSGLPRNDVPDDHVWLTAFVDVHLDLLYWTVAAWGAGFAGSIVDYGTFPEQAEREFRMRDAKHTLRKAAARANGGSAGPEALILAGLKTLVDTLSARTWLREDGEPMQISQGLIDAGWGKSTGIVYETCRRNGKGLWLPSHGKGITASGEPIDAKDPKPNERVGEAWRIMPAQTSRFRHKYVVFDSNYWKTFCADRWRTAAGDPGSLTLYGDDPHQHKTFSQHVSAEFPVETHGRGRRVDEWKLPPDHPDNHWGDTVVGCAVGASILGASLLNVRTHFSQKKRIKFNEWRDAG